jgi:hypothetical protein
MQQFILNMDSLSDATLDRELSRDLEMIKHYYIRHIELNANH